MKRSLFLWLLAMACALCAAPFSALATPLTLTFGDSQKYWPGHGNSDQDSWPGWDNNLDTIGDPNFTGGTVTLSDNYELMTITINASSWGTGTTWSKLAPGDLFLDVDPTPGWDYVVYNPNPKQPMIGTTPQTPSIATTWKIYSLTTTPSYELSGEDNKGYWKGYLIRDGHPIGLAQPTGNALSYNAKFGGWGTPTLTFDLSSALLPLISTSSGGMNIYTLTLGFTVNCANDVLYETLRWEAPTPPQQLAPEPASMLLMGSGLVSLAGYMRMRSRRKGQSA